MSLSGVAADMDMTGAGSRAYLQSGLSRLEAPIFRNSASCAPSGMWNQAYLQRSLEVVGPERIIFSTDHPYQYRPGRPGRAFLEAATLSPEDKELFAHGNWERLVRSGSR